MNQSPVAALAAASEMTGLPRDNFEVHEISKAEFEKLRGAPVPGRRSYFSFREAGVIG